MKTGDIEGKGIIEGDSLVLASGATIDEFSTDATLSSNSDTKIPTQKAVKAYADAITSMTFDTTTVFASAAAPTSFTDLDLSSVVGANKALVLLRVENNSADAYYKFRENGMTDDIGFPASNGYGGGTSAGVASNGRSIYIVVATDASGIVEWICQSGATTIVHMVGYLK